MEIKRFTRLEDGTREDYLELEEYDRELNKMLADDVLALFMTTHRDNGYALDPMLHALQTATRALRDGASEEMVVAALLHDIGDRVSPVNHSRVGAEILRPYVSEETYWVLAHHALFQRYYYAHHLGQDRNVRERYRDNPHYDVCAKFCELWDQVSFDPDYDTLPLETFVPMVRRVFARQPYSLWPSNCPDKH